MADQSLHGKVVLLTGASSGLGRAFAVALARAGARLFLVARREEKLREVVHDL
jgi:NADP-dependent 3-hydroxy acid dehydrogenase YdfG